MRLIPDPNMERWLEEFIPYPSSFDWNKANRTKNLKHGVSAEEVESLFTENRYFFAGKIMEPSHPEWRGLILGLDKTDRGLALIFTIRGEKVRPISCRIMRESERRSYEAHVTEETTKRPSA